MANLPAELYSTKIRNVALCDYLARRFGFILRSAGADRAQESGGWSGSKGNDVRIDIPGQHVLQRTAVLITGKPWQ